MRVANLGLIGLIAVIATACGGGGGGSGGSGGGSNPVPNPLPTPAGNNYLQIKVSPNSAGVCSAANSGVNLPCVTVTVCNGSSCATVNNVLIDSGSTGLRIFKSTLPTGFASGLTYESQNGQSIAECVGYGDGTANWGQVAQATVQLNGVSTTSQIPIQIIDPSYFNGGPCSGGGSTGGSATPDEFGYNGVLGVSPLVYDGGDYYTCSTGNGCSSKSVPQVQQVTNPISQLSAPNNNGVTFEFPALPANGAAGAIGYAIFGVGELPIVPGVSSYQLGSICAARMGCIYTTLNGVTATSFLDTGSNMLFFNNNSLPLCNYGGLYCPNGNSTLTAYNRGAVLGAPSIPVNFNVGNGVALLNSANTAFNNLGMVTGALGNNFDWGLPFFFGRTVYVGFQGQSSSLGVGPYWAY